VRTSNRITEIHAGLRALDREETALSAILRQRVQEALNDPRLAIPAEQVLADLRAYHAERIRAAKRGA
jgi:antitoxin ParD1/3/4